MRPVDAARARHGDERARFGLEKARRGVVGPEPRGLRDARARAFARKAPALHQARRFARARLRPSFDAEIVRGGGEIESIFEAKAEHDALAEHRLAVERLARHFVRSAHVFLRVDRVSITDAALAA